MTDRPIDRQPDGGLFPPDDDVILALDWVNGHVGAEQDAALDRRYLADAAFAEQVDVWLEALAVPELPAILDEVNAQDAGKASTPRDVASESPWRRRTWRIFEVLNATATAYAVASLVSVGIGYWALERMTSAPEGIVVTTVPHRVASPPRAGAQGTPQAAVPGDSTRASAVVLAALDLGGAEFRADSGADKLVELPTGSRILVRSGSTVRYAPTPGRVTGGNVEVRGEAAIHVSRRQLFVLVVSRAGVAQLLPGSYALRCVGRCATLDVTVDTGSANLTVDRRGATGLSVRTGQFGQAPRDGEPSLVSPELAGAFPAIEPSFRRLP